MIFIAPTNISPKINEANCIKSLFGLAPSFTCIAEAISTSPIKNNNVIINIRVLSNPL